MKRLTMIALALGLFVPALAMAQDADKDEAKPKPGEVIHGDWRVTGEPVDSVRLNMIRDTQILDDQHILFRMRGGEVYVNRLDYRCGGLRNNRTFAYDTRINRLTNLDIIDVLETIGPGLQRIASCGVGYFYPVEAVEDA